MLAEVRLVICPRGVRLTITKGDEVVEDEAWALDRAMGHTEAAEVAKAIFDDCYDLMQTLVHGDVS